MPTEVILPRVDMDMTEAVLGQWLVKEGQSVKQGDIIFEIETTKANMEVESPASGTLRYISAEEGEEYAVGTTLAWIYAEGEADTPPPSLTVTAEGRPADSADNVSTEPETVAESEHEDTSLPSGDDTNGIRATPKARMLARQAGIDLRGVQGSGPGGRIEAADITGTVQPQGETPLACVWLREGKGKIPLVVIHGFGADHSSWQPLTNGLRSIAPELPVLAIDLPAHGQSCAVEAASFNEMLELVQRTLNGLGINECHLLGHSLGGAVSLALAAREEVSGAATRIASLWLLAPVGLGPEIHRGFVEGMLNSSQRDSLVPWLKLLLSDTNLLDSRFIDAVSEPMAHNDIRQRRAKLMADCVADGTQLQDLRSCLDTLNIPVKVVWGIEDRIIPVTHTDGLGGHVAVHRFAGCGHLPQLEAKNGVLRLLGDVLG